MFTNCMNACSTQNKICWRADEMSRKILKILKSRREEKTERKNNLEKLGNSGEMGELIDVIVATEARALPPASDHPRGDSGVGNRRRGGASPRAAPPLCGTWTRYLRGRLVGLEETKGSQPRIEASTDSAEPRAAWIRSTLLSIALRSCIRSTPFASAIW